MNVPNIASAVSDNNIHQEQGAWLCIVNAEYQGVIKFEKVSAIEVYANNELAVLGLNSVIAQYHVDDIWGAWIEWVYKEYRYSNHYNRMGPRYFFDFTWNYWEWTDTRGAHVIRHLPVPVKNSIWCDTYNTDGEIYITSFEHSYLNTQHANGWLRANRLAEHNVIESYHFPAMP